MVMPFLFSSQCFPTTHLYVGLSFVRTSENSQNFGCVPVCASKGSRLLNACYISIRRYGHGGFFIYKAVFSIMSLFFRLGFLPLAPLRRRHNNNNGRHMVSFYIVVWFFNYLSIIIIFSFLQPPRRWANVTTRTWDDDNLNNGQLMVFSLYRCVVFLLHIIVILASYHQIHHLHNDATRCQWNDVGRPRQYGYVYCNHCARLDINFYSSYVK
jgi:hypothetical protein